MSGWIELARKLIGGFGDSKDVRCAICHGAKMKPIGKINGYTTYECEAGHYRTPGLDVGDRDGLIETTRGHQSGEI